MIHVGADGECLYVDLYMNYNEVHNHLHVDRFRFRTHTTHISTRPNANKAGSNDDGSDGDSPHKRATSGE